jgi:hypothetical protein
MMVDMVEASLTFQALKTQLLAATGLSKDALHVYLGLAMFLAVRLLWRRRGGWIAAWAAALALALTGEWLDLRGEAIRSALQSSSSHWHDIWNTMFWPTALLLVGRWLHPTPASPVAVSADESAQRSPE